MNKNKIFLLNFLILIFISNVCFAKNKNVPIQVNSDKMVYTQDKNVVVFLGNVYVKQGKLNLWADKITVFFATQKIKNQDIVTAGGNKDIKKIVAEGKVKIVKEDKEARCGLAIYWPETKKIVLEKNPILKQKENEIQGEKIVFYLDNNSLEIFGNNTRRVQAIFFEQGKGIQSE
ncbi:MAG: lipopolysaccharide transport periplasmic protein LptA [Desulfonauticus sp.]|nr:lipopolysaccharide transport periplasmic protein LptA [Desulfonauticus sp.]